MSSIDLQKKKIIDLSKVAEEIIAAHGLNGETVEVKVAYDVSGSMAFNYASGEMQNVSDRLLGLAMKFDADKSIDLYAFDRDSHDLGSVNEDNFYGFVRDHVEPLVGGGTQYAPVMKDIVDSTGITIDTSVPVRAHEKKGFFQKLFGQKEEVITPQEVQVTPMKPVYVIFITDGDNFDHAPSESIIRESAKYGIFWKFVGIGNASFNFLRQLDNMTGRVIDNANFIEIQDIASISEQELYNLLLEEFPSWLKEARQKGIVN